MIRQVIGFLALCVFSSVLVAEPVKQSTSLADQAKNSSADVSSQSLFRYKAGLLNGHAEKMPLEKVLADLSAATGLKSVLKYKPEEGEVVSFRVKDKVLTDGLKEVLRNHNYLFIPGANAKEVSKLIVLGNRSAGAQEQQAPLRQEKHAEVTGSPDEKPAGPRSLDEFRKLNLAGGDTVSLHEETAEQREAREAREREELEQKTERAMDALDSDFRGLKEDAIGELTGVNSPEATNALLNTALNGEDKDLQQYAAEALWRHAADFGFKNPEANQALQALAEDGNSTTREYARKALEDARRYAENAGDGGS